MPDRNVEDGPPAEAALHIEKHRNLGGHFPFFSRFHPGFVSAVPDV